MNKFLFLIRHAKSSWKDLSLDDFDRPLKKRGKFDAILMGEKLNKNRFLIDLIISSPAKRTIETVKIISDKIGYNSEILYNKNIYEASEETLINIIKSIKNNFNNVIIVGHNPGLTNLANHLLNKSIYNVPTCGIVAIKINGNWSELNSDNCEMIFFDYPKKYKDQN